MAAEVENVLANHQGNPPDAYSDTTGNPIIFGTTSTGKRIAVVYSDESDADLVIIRPVTAYPVREYGG
jgi:predicted alpha/beta-hydrolase family hydrolase